MSREGFWPSRRPGNPTHSFPFGRPPALFARSPLPHLSQFPPHRQLPMDASRLALHSMSISRDAHADAMAALCDHEYSANENIALRARAGSRRSAFPKVSPAITGQAELSPGAQRPTHRIDLHHRAYYSFCLSSLSYRGTRNHAPCEHGRSPPRLVVRETQAMEASHLLNLPLCLSTPFPSKTSPLACRGRAPCRRACREACRRA